MLDLAELPRYLAKIDRTFDISKLLELRADKDTIVRYYTESERGYRLLHSWDGSVHMTLAGSDPASDNDNLGQARFIQQQITRLAARSILELGCGKGFNVAHLARVNEEARIVGVDLTPKHIHIASEKYAKVSNLEFQIGDFQSLQFGNEEFDLVFEVEALCHAENPQLAFGEVFRVLKPGGRFVIFDGFRAADLTAFSQDLQRAVQLVELTMAVKQFPPLHHWLGLAKDVGFKTIATDDLSDAIMPNLERFQVLARGFYKYPRLAKQLIRTLPPALVKNSVAGLLLPFTVSSGAQRYHSIVLEK